jgi:hypothetical protein
MRVFPRAVLLAGLAVLFGGVVSLAQDDFKLEPGFTLLFNGKDLTGWKTKKGGESLDGKAEAYGKRFVVSDGKLIIDPKVKGDVIIETAKTFGKDVHIKFEFMPGDGCNNDLFLRGIKFDINPKQLKNLKDGWNEIDIIVKGDKGEVKINGATEKSPAAKADATPFGIRAEFGSIQIRRIRVKE